ncbi:MAG: cupin domain-containing protein [Chloroflexi bacterium]|nr:cupin domain-containing protein [Chloroflexota bacterium]
MERITERRREPEPVAFNRRIEETQLRLGQEAGRVASLPRVLKAADIPWEKSMQTALSRQWVSAAPRDRLAKAPIRTMGILEQILEPGMKGGRHRHVREAIFYIIDGEGYEIHDGKRYDWAAGDIMAVPSYCDHQHFNPDPRLRSRMWYSIPVVVEFMGIHWIEQIETGPGYRLAEGTQPVLGPGNKIIGYRTPDGQEVKFELDESIQSRLDASSTAVETIDAPANSYDEYIKLLQEEVRWRASAPHVVKGADVPWENTRMGKIKFLVTPRSGCGLKAYDAFLQEMPPGGCSGRHRHAAEEAHKILRGRGYDVHDGVRHDWEAEDVVCIPPYVEHQHFNSDPRETALFVAFQSRLYGFLGHGGIYHLEDAGPRPFDKSRRHGR